MIDQISLTNFRNFASLNFKPPLGISILYGQNAQGKTNLLEAFNYLSTLKSYRHVSDKELVRWGAGFAVIEGTKAPHTERILIQDTKREIKIDNTAKKVWEALGEFKTVVFSPEDVGMVTGNPSGRRRFLDLLIAKTDRQYIWSLLRIKEVLRNRNRVLYQIKQGRRHDLAAWDEQLADLALEIWKKRLTAVGFFNLNLRSLTQAVGLPNPLKIRFQTSNQLETLDKGAFLDRLSKVRAEEIRRCATLLGPHRDDFLSLEEKSGRDVDLALYGSRGEQRSFLVALKATETDYIEKLSGERPTLLLDDILSELDQDHRGILYNFAVKQQTVLTTAVLDILPQKLLQNAQVYEVIEATLNKR